MVWWGSSKSGSVRMFSFLVLVVGWTQVSFFHKNKFLRKKWVRAKRSEKLKTEWIVLSFGIFAIFTILFSSFECLTLIFLLLLSTKKSQRLCKFGYLFAKSNICRFSTNFHERQLFFRRVRRSCCCNITTFYRNLEAAQWLRRTERLFLSWQLASIVWRLINLLKLLLKVFHLLTWRSIWSGPRSWSECKFVSVLAKNH